VSPGLIDVQINGAYGVDFSELNVDEEDGGEASYLAGLDKVAARIVETGCTSFVPTIITQKEELYAKVGCYTTRTDPADPPASSTSHRPFFRYKSRLPR